MANKRCSKCGETKPLSEFNLRSDRPGTLRPACKVCQSRSSVASRRALQSWRRPGKRRIQRAYILKKKFGLSIEQVDQMEQDQGGVCAICHRPELAQDVRAAEPRHLSVDHDHSKQKGDPKFIGLLLCHSCNVALGLMGDSPDRLRAAAKYLEVYRG